MAGIDETIVREYFELNGFLVRQLRKYAVQSRSKRTEEEIDLLVYNPVFSQREGQSGFILFSSDLPYIHRAIVAVKGWHSRSFTPATLRSSSAIFTFLEKDVLKKAGELFAIKDDDELVENMGSLKKLLVLPGLPTHEPHRTQSINLLREHGVDGILSFRSILQDLHSKVEVNHSYQKSDLLQTLRILKNYDMIKSPQLEFFGEAAGGGRKR